MPPPDPARAGSTSASVNVTLGDTTSPPPSPASRNTGASLGPIDPDRCGTSRSISTSATLTPTSPPTASQRPYRSTSFPLTYADTADPTAKGVVVRPASNAVYLSPTCR